MTEFLCQAYMRVTATS